MDVDKSSGGKHSLDFGEFLAGVYNYCTMQHDVLVKFAFDLFDSDSSGTIDRKEIKEASEEDRGGLIDRSLPRFDCYYTCSPPCCGW